MLIAFFQFEQLANVKFLCKPGKSAVEVVVSLSAVYGGVPLVHLIYRAASRSNEYVTTVHKIVTSG
jgi:hypothetical protein